MQLESTLTDRYQTTVPGAVRRVLKLGKRDRISYSLQPDGSVVIARADSADADDPELGLFLGFLANDLAAHPQRATGLNAQWLNRIQSLVGKVKSDLDAALPDEE
ncbi:MAG: type II toxin-antitoxin system PrlF family antitoxin [Rhodanobacter sp.]